MAFHLAKVCRHKSMSMFGSERAASTDVGKET